MKMTAAFSSASFCLSELRPAAKSLCVSLDKMESLRKLHIMFWSANCTRSLLVGGKKGGSAHGFLLSNVKIHANTNR